MLADIAGCYVILDVRSDTWPGEIAADKLGGFFDAMVTSGSFIMGLKQEGGSKIVVIGYVDAGVVKDVFVR